MSSKGNSGLLRNLSPAEIEIVKGQIAAMLNYTTPGPAPAKIPSSIRAKISDQDAKAISAGIDKLLTAK